MRNSKEKIDMTGMLASVKNLEEACLVMAEHVDIIDLKEPALGSLGAVNIGVVEKIVAKVNNQCLVSATIGDLPMNEKLIVDAVNAMAATGVDYIKIGIFPSKNQRQIIHKLADIDPNVKKIAVLFADIDPDLKLIEYLKEAGFTGVMLDTLDKKSGSLTEIMTASKIESFVKGIQSARLLCGLAGSLRLDDIAALIPYQPDYLGFRGALCVKQMRAGMLDRYAVNAIKQTIQKLAN